MRDALLKLARRVAIATLERSIDVVDLALVVLGVPPLIVVSPPPKESHDADPTDVDPVSNLQSGAELGLHRDERRGPDNGRELPPPAQAPDLRCEEAQRAGGPVETAPQQLPSRKTCSKCGFIGGNARGCGTSHKTISDDDGKPGSGQSEPHETQQGASTPGQRASVAAGNVADSPNAPIGHRSVGPSSSTSPGPLTAIEQPPSKSRHLKPTAAAVAEAKERIARRNVA